MGEALSEISRDALVGNPGDPLIGFPTFFNPNRRELRTDNREQPLKITILSLIRKSLFAHRGQSLGIRRRRSMRWDSITEAHTLPRDGWNPLPRQ
jgi:hypothetical protein